MSDKLYAEEEQSQENYKHFSSNNNPLRNNQIRFKKRNIPIDREQLYSQNIELKNKVRQLTELNIKMRTQLSITEKEKLNLCNIAEEQAFHPKIQPRMQSSNHKKSLGNILPQHQQNAQSLFNNPLSKQKQNMAFKKMLRDQKLQIQKLNNENQRLKKTMKYTRMNELLSENKELLDETIRLKAILSEVKDIQNINYTQYSNQIDNLKKKLALEKDTEKRNGYELKKQMEVLNEVRERLREAQSKKIQTEKRLNKEVKQLRAELGEVKSKTFQNSSQKIRECEKEDCVKNRKQKNEVKKRNQNLQKQIKRYKDQLDSIKRRSLQKEVEHKNLADSALNRKLQTTAKANINQKKAKQGETKPNVAQQSKFSTTKDDQTKMQQSKLSQKSEEGLNVIIFDKQPKKQTKQNEQVKNSYKQIKIESTIQQSKKEGKIQPILTQQSKINPLQSNIKQDPIIKVDTNNDDSMDTQKLLESVQNSNKLKIEPTNHITDKEKGKQKLANQLYQKGKIIDEEIKVKNKPEEIKTKPILEQKIETQQKKYQQQFDDGEYEELNYEEFDQFDGEKPKQQKPSQLQKKKKVKQTQGQEKPKKKKTAKQKQKSTKKIQHKEQSDQQILYRNQENKKEKQQIQDDKSSLKLIKQSLLYKFIAQRYSYDDFCKDISSSDIKDFSITQIMNLLSEEPFLLIEENIESIIIYLFDTTELTGEEKISTKNFMKKMKKFIGKAKAPNDEQEDKNIQKLKEIIEKDEQGGKKIRKKCKQLDSGNNSITKQSFVKVMSQIGVKGELLQSAIAQIAYVSPDLNSLNYQFFINRFTQIEQ